MTQKIIALKWEPHWTSTHYTSANFKYVLGALYMKYGTDFHINWLAQKNFKSSETKQWSELINRKLLQVCYRNCNESRTIHFTLIAYFFLG